MMAELEPLDVLKWEAALTVLDWDINRWAPAKICEVLHQVAERFASHENDFQAKQAWASLPQRESFMELLRFDEAPPNFHFHVQSQEEISRTLKGRAR